MTKVRMGTVYIVMHWFAYEGQEPVYASLDRDKAQKWRDEHEALLRREEGQPGKGGDRPRLEGFDITEIELS